MAVLLELCIFVTVFEVIFSHSTIYVQFCFRINHVEKSAIQDLKERIIASQYELTNEFKKYDPENKGMAFTDMYPNRQELIFMA